MDDEPRQRIERVGRRRRVRLTPAPGTDAEPAVDDDERDAPPPTQGPNDERMRRDVPPHW